ncbi:uncharacterized protein MELLADRAFT_101206 [Melampsora larici-populina 98AG31]|uniref:Uncharacterized protein n=1 Tax=Melampsora larici-populina (strain 98AG31 / pathotype 3-4-7) TaxID=747676 RepID=F4R3Z3_MELLP|nr:uncharacterized protein MELLADRAFT_101206 [Melampsora larici-populina 98AG31]EGG12707.1 hypothetical protein MELLADRAFT_101206 [Melampsora larici-populina 98AG31]
MMVYPTTIASRCITSVTPKSSKSSYANSKLKTSQRPKSTKHTRPDAVEDLDNEGRLEKSESTTQFISAHHLGPEVGKSFMSPDLVSFQHNGPTSRRIPPKSTCLKTQTSNLVDLNPESAVIPSVTKVKVHPDLIEFSDLDLFETENHEPDRVIPSIINNETPKSGVNVFQMEQLRNDKKIHLVLALEESLSRLTSKVEMAEKEAIDHTLAIKNARQQGMSNTNCCFFTTLEKLTQTADDLLQELKARVALLEKKTGTIDQLKGKIASIEQKFTQMKENLDEALSELQKQEEIITKMMGLPDSEYSSSE